MITYKWNESTFDKRFISDDSEYVELVHKTILERYHKHEGLSKSIKAVENVSGLLREDVELIVRNEHTILNTLELKDMYEALDTKKYSIVSPSNCCTYQEDTVYSFSDFELFITAPPLHYGCSATITPVEDDDDFDYFQEPEDRKANGKRTLDEILADWEKKAEKLIKQMEQN
ncbi:hypothetical protein NHG32_07120 [Aerococcaceae bacterium NML191219]|nr:hypothetical protein [Aerococcaceae bacterium NML191219]